MNCLKIVYGDFVIFLKVKQNCLDYLSGRKKYILKKIILTIQFTSTIIGPAWPDQPDRLLRSDFKIIVVITFVIRRTFKEVDICFSRTNSVAPLVSNVWKWWRTTLYTGHVTV